MEIPKNTEVHETSSSYFWFDENGILISVGKDNPPKISKEEQQKETEAFLSVFGNKKRCMLLDVKHPRQSSSQDQKEAAKLLEQLTTAMAVIIYNPMGRMVINIFVGLQKPSYPMKIFKPGEEEKAIEWLKQYL